MTIIVTLRNIAGDLQVHDSPPHIIFQPTNTIFVSADLWLLNIELDISNHSGYITDVERAAAALQGKIRTYHMAVNDYNPGRDEPSPHFNTDTFNPDSESNFTEQQDYFGRARRGQKIRSREKALMQQENILLQKEYDFLISVIRETKDKFKDLTELLEKLDPQPLGIKTTIPNIDRSQQTNNSKQRKKRMIGLLGSVLAFYTLGQINELKKHTALLTDNMNQMTKYQQKTFMWITQSSKITAENAENMRNMESHISDLTKQIQRQLQSQSINHWKLVNLSYIRSIIRSGISLLSMISQHLRDSVQDLSFQISQCIHGELPIDLLSVKNITSTIADINKHLENGKRLAFDDNQLHQVLKQPVLIYAVHNKIHTILSFPVLKSTADTFEIYRIHDFPVYV
ncbi:MAG: hypothetical protein GY781_06945, partial [Gammaproteobacteria bacterium]|nr:hypothetical protein [Gammaproteobacteria bacterium]